ncbi:YVTN repeat-like/Quino protein amine dehydrogenase [Thelephora ganbajun]|uniref:YVTN repeat-like/Quino protein amine dehydrogenase n=1 Tax=Thelephora ganbajun TaxID=370292 RepID=A0ACB6Z5Q9_THEGA|nr:YVTN repeat-like/Quino protein amine dehydrogenase [Thelephora ganbajun]
MAQQMAIYEQARKLINTAEASVLNNFRCAQGAEYRHGDRTGCLKGTRTAVLDQIELWTRDFNKPPVYWLNGLAGTGKSTIAQTIAERIFAGGQLGASFFCSRDFEDRRNLHFIFPTLAVQLARKYTEFRSIFVPLVRSDPAIAHESLYNQMKKLIVEPLEKSSISTVIVIDALDECKDEEPASAILSVLGQFVSKIPKVKFFLTGRPEPRIRKGFGLPLLAEATDVLVLHEVESGRVDRDIRLFLKYSFLEIADRRGGLDGWPTKEQLDLLCERAAGLFVYAVATIQCIDHKNKNPKKQLDRLLLLPKSTVYEGKVKFKENTTLDSLYTSILQEAFGDDDPEDDPMVRSILGAVTLAANPLSPSAIGTLLGFDTEDVFPLLSSIHSLLALQEDTDQPVRPFHKSFPDFIVDPARCINQRFRVSPPNHHIELLSGCLNLMNRTLEKNMCRLPDAVANSEVPDLRERTERYISPALQYACKSWHKHLVDQRTARTPEITSALHRFLENKFMFWLEVLSVLGAAREAVDALDLVTKRSEASPTVELANDCFRFVTGFFEVIEESAPHIYHSALSVSPQKSMVRKLYDRHANPLTRIVHGLPVSWDPAIVTMEYSYVAATAWSPCGRFIAISNDGLRTEILDAATLKRLTILEFPQGQTDKLVFSPDARLLMRYSAKPDKFISWDLQTGVLVGAISPEQWDDNTECSSITYSTCGTMFGALICISNAFTIRTYNVHSGTHIYSHSVEGEVVHNIWTHGECLRFAVVKSGSITTWEVGFSSRNPPTEIESLPLPANLSHDLHPRSFHPTLSRLAFTHSKKIFVWDARHSKFLLNEDAWHPHGISFSSDGRFFIYGTLAPQIYLWKESPTGYILHRKLDCEIEIYELLISPSGESIFASGLRAIQLWRTMDPTASFSRKPTDERFIVEFSPDETLATITRFKDNAIAVLDLKSGDPLSIIDTGMKVYGQRVTGSTVVAVDHGKVVAWNLPARDLALNAKANVNDSIRTVTTSCPGMLSHPYSLEFASISPDLHSIAIVEGTSPFHCYLHLHDMPTGQCLGSVPMHGKGYRRPWFTSDGRQVWYITDHGEANGLTIVEDSRSGVIKLEQLGPTNQSPNTPPWLSSRGYQIVDDGWILSLSGKRLLWLPPHWRPLDTEARTWSGRFLALLYNQLPEAVILELEE